jgi:predicted kinase
VGVQLTAIGSPEDKFWRFREVLLARLDLRSAYDRLKADHEGRSSAEYRNAKAAFFVTLMSTPEYRALDQHMAEADILSAVTPSVSNAGAEQGHVFVVMSGPPGSGKSTIAPTLAAQLGIPLFSKDTIKESLMDALGVDDAAASRRLGAAAIRVMLALARENGRGLLDNNWAASLAIDDLHALGAPIVEVFCRCPPEVSRGRHAARRRHPGHFDEMRAADDDLWFGRASRPLAGGWPVIEIDTVTPVNVPALAQQVKTLAQLA